MNRHRMPASLALLVVLLSFLPAGAQKPEVLPPRAPEKTAPPPVRQPQTPPRLTAEDLEAYFDGFLPIQIQRDDIAGAVVLVV